MKKQALTLSFLFLVFLMSACRPEQAGTDYTITEQPIGQPVEDPNGNNVGDDDDDSGNGSGNKLEDYITDCDKATQENALLTETYTVSFPAAIECEFNEQGTTAQDINSVGNGPRINSWIMARIEQYYSVPFPDDRILCNAEFDFPEQSMKYDDEIFLTMNDNVMISSVNYSTANNDPAFSNGLKINDLGLMEYNWMGTNALYNLPYKQTGKYCLGLNPNDPDYDQKCHIPYTETVGQMKLDLPSDSAIKLGIRNSENKIKFGFITLGDNDAGDCEHSAYSFEVTVRYIQKN